MPKEPFEDFLEQLNSDDPEEAWSLFLAAYSSTILKVVRHVEHDADLVADRFQFVCESLSANSFRRLRKFRTAGPAVFSTWLRAVVRNLCLDWRRKQFGRRRPFKSISQLSSFDQEVFRHLYERRAPVEDTIESLRAIFPNTTREQLSESSLRIENVLTPKQRQLLAARFSQQVNQASTSFDDTARSADLRDPAPSPEDQAVFAQRATALRRALDALPEHERLLVRLRFEQDLTLDQIARLLQLGNAQRVERQIKAVLIRLREELE